jgi:hypothetical protein
MWIAIHSMRFDILRAGELKGLMVGEYHRAVLGGEQVAHSCVAV